MSSHVGDHAAQIAKLQLTHVERRSRRLSTSELEQRVHLDASGSSIGSSVVRVAPLLTVFGKEGDRTIVTGRTLVVVDMLNEIALEASIAAAWHEDGAARGSFDVIDITTDENMAKIAISLASIMPLRKPRDVGETNEDVAANVAKELCETSREAVADIRDIRYFLEHELARSSAGDISNIDHTTVVASLLQLNIILRTHGR